MPENSRKGKTARETGWRRQAEPERPPASPSCTNSLDSVGKMPYDIQDALENKKGPLKDGGGSVCSEGGNTARSREVRWNQEPKRQVAPEDGKLRGAGSRERDGALGIFLRIDSSTTFLPSSSFKPGPRR